MKPYKCIQRKDCYKMEIVTWKHVIVYKLLILDRNTLRYTTVWKSFVLNGNTWYPITVVKNDYRHIKKMQQNIENIIMIILIKKLHTKYRYIQIMYAIPQFLHIKQPQIGWHAIKMNQSVTSYL